MFNIPIVLFLFKRNKITDVIKRVAEVQPRKVYLIGDGARTQEEQEQVCACRKLAEEAITWDCEVIKNYAETNRGVYENIAGGAKWVFEREESAIFLEDDNLPEVTFFQFCSEMLDRYKEDSRILWVCGTNYLGKYVPDDGVSYVFTKHMLPCGWASWSKKFCAVYDGNLDGCEDNRIMANIGKEYVSPKLYQQCRKTWMSEWERKQKGQRFLSWDYQMDFSIKANSVFGICPCNNQIKNIGADADSIHGGSSAASLMTKRFCGMESYPIEFPLHHPTTVLADEKFEKMIGDIILVPDWYKAKCKFNDIIRMILRIPSDIRTADYVKGLLHLK